MQDAQGHPAVVLGDAGVAVVGAPYDRHVSGACHEQLAAVRGDAHQAAGREQVTAQRDQQIVGAGQHRARVGRDAGERPEAGAGLTHEGGGLHPVPLHIADGDPRDPVPHRERVVEVATDSHSVLRGRVPGADPDAREVGQLGGEHVPLQGQAHLRPGALEPDVLQGLIDKTPKSEEELLGVVGCVAVSVHGVPARCDAMGSF